jgi:NTE family protein
MFFSKSVDINKSFIVNYAQIFSRLTKPEKSLILQKSQVVHYKKGEAIYKQGDPPDAFYCVISGRVKIFKLTAGKEEALEFITCGMYFGIISLLTTQTHSVNAEAVNDSLILKIKKDDFDFILKKIPALAIDLSRTLSQQIRSRDYSRKTLKSNIISIYSAVKGIGRTMYAFNLALSLRRETNKKVIFVEISSSGKELIDLFNLNQVDLINLENSVLNKEIIDRFIVKSDGLGVYLLSISHNPESKVALEQISALSTLLTNDYQYVILDLPVERDEFVFRTLTQSDTIHIITDYNIANLKATRALMVDLFRNVSYPQEKIRIILNARKGSAKITHEEVLKILDHDIFANVPVFWKSADKINALSLKVVQNEPDSEYAKAIRRISREIGGVLVGLALGSGAAFGLSHIGVIKVLEREKIPVDVVAGTSIGALIGALWASGKSGTEVEDIMMGYNKNKAKGFRLLFDFCFPKTSLAKGKRVTQFLNKHLEGKTFYDLKIPLKVVACNLNKREKIVYESGNLVEAVRSSLAIPGIFKPIISEGNLIIDGGILEPLPVEALAKVGIKKIIAVNVLPSPADIQQGYKDYKYHLETEKVNMQKGNFFLKIIYRIRLLFNKIFFPNVFDIMVNSILAMEYVMARQVCQKADVVIHPIITGANWFEFFRTEALVKKGELEAEKALPQIKALINQ